jgi:hypothetical protein
MLEPETNQLCGLLEQRLALMNLLGRSLAEANADIVRFDIDGFERRIQDQGRMCLEIQSLDAAIEEVQNRCTEKIRMNETPHRNDPGTARLQNVVNRLEQTKKHVRELNDQHRDLLRRSRRTVTALLNSYQTFAGTYSNPALGGRTSLEIL